MCSYWLEILSQSGHFTARTPPDGATVVCHENTPCHIIASTEKNSSGTWCVLHCYRMILFVAAIWDALNTIKRILGKTSI